MLNFCISILGLITLTASSLSAELSSPETLVEHLVAHRYDILHGTLEKDAKVLVSQLALDDETEVITGENRLRLLLLTALSKLPLAKISAPEWTSQHGPFLSWLFADAKNLSELASEIRKEDKGAKVLELWSEIWTAETNPQFRTKYAKLSLALALLYDSPNAFKKSKENRYNPGLTMMERYLYFRDASEGGRLDTPCDRMTVRDLVRVIDTPVSQEEIDWVHSHVSGSRKKAGSTYSDIEYLMERAVKGVNPYKAYILSEIKKHGGICGDQSYYSSNAAKVRGIPAMTVVGTGDRGAHAWIAFMPDDNEWTSFGSQGITNGTTYCTQRGKRISFRLLALESLDDYEPKKREPALLHLTLAKAAIASKSFETVDFLVARAKKIAKHNLDIWEVEERALLASEAEPEAWKNYLDSLERTFDEYPNVLEWALKLKIRNVFAKLPGEERMKLLDREIRRVARELGSEENALITVVDRIAGMLAEEEEADGIKSLYSKSFRRYGEDLELSTKLVESYTKQGAKLSKLAPQIPAELYKSYKRFVETNSKELFRAQMELRIFRSVAKAYKELGGEEGAKQSAKIEEDIAKRHDRVARAAL